MRFILNEAFDEELFQGLSQEYKNIPSSSPEKQKAFLQKNVINLVSNVTDDPKIRTSVIQYIVKYLNNPEVNEKFLQYIFADEISSSKIQPEFWKKMQAVLHYMSLNKLEWQDEFLYSESLYNRPEDEYNSTLEAFVNYTDDEWLKYHIASTNNVDVSEFMIGNQVKKWEDIEAVIRGWQVESDENVGKMYSGNDYYTDFDNLDQEYRKLDSLQARTNFISKKVMSHPQIKSIRALRDTIENSILVYGIALRNNPWLRFVLKLDFIADKADKYKAKFKHLYESFRQGLVALTDEILLNPSLYARSDADFRYTLNAFRMFSEDGNYTKYLKDTSVVDLSQFMDGDRIKPAGLQKDRKLVGKTIWNVIEAWAEDNEYNADEREKRAKNQSKNGATINSILTKSQLTYESFVEMLNSSYSKVKTTISEEDLQLLLYTVFVLPKVNKLMDNETIYSFSLEAVDVKGTSKEEVGRSDALSHSGGEFEPGKIIHLPNAPNQPLVLWMNDNMTLLGKLSHDREHIDNILGKRMSTITSLRQSMLSQSVESVNKKNLQEVSIAVVKALAEYANSSGVSSTLDDIWE